MEPRSLTRSLPSDTAYSSRERILDITLAKDFTYNLSESKRWSARRLTSIVVAHVRHACSDYDELLREEFVERYEARQKTGSQVWKVLREWCPWDESNDVLGRCFKATLVRPEEREAREWEDLMDVDSDSELFSGRAAAAADVDDPMELD